MATNTKTNPTNKSPNTEAPNTKTDTAAAKPAALKLSKSDIAKQIGGTIVVLAPDGDSGRFIAKSRKLEAGDVLAIGHADQTVSVVLADGRKVQLQDAFAEAPELIDG